MAMDFGPTVYTAGEGLMVRTGETLTGIDGLNGQQVAVVEGSGSREILLTAAQEAGISVTVLPQATLEDAIALLEGGQVIAVAGERADMLGPSYERSGVDVLPLRLTRVPLAMGLPEGDSAFRDMINLTMQAMRAEGQFDALFSIWFDDAPPAWEVWPGTPYRDLRIEITTP